jgi:TolB-like protein/DNA-binding winged helix-turn-helix (wHTH) protein/Flp pilus assembly protein TadD
MNVARNAPPAPVYEFGEFSLDARKRLLWRAGTQVRLAPRVFETLLFLVEHHDTVLDKERLMEAVWPDSIVEENNLTQNISALRRVFGETPGSHHYIVTVPGRGYRFVADVKILETNAGPPPLRRAEPAISPAANGAEQSASTAGPDHRRNFQSILLAAVVLLMLSVATLFFWRGRTQNPSEAAAGIASPKIVLPEKSIAVLPFANLSADKENAFFTEGVQDDILTALAKCADLKVISRTSVTNYVAGPNRNLRQIGQELGVGNILEGSVRRADGKVRVTAQLIETQTNTHLWAETYDRELADVFAIQSDIAQRIANALQAKLAPDEKARLDAKPTANSEAYVLYLTARGTEDLNEAEKFYMQAVALDPGFALAYAQASIINSGFSVHEPTRKARARALAEEALRLAPALGEAHMALGLCLYWAEKNYEGALKEFEVAAATSPNNAEIHVYIGGIYRRQGRWRESIASFERALSLDPRNHGIAFPAANNYLFVRDWAAAAAGFNRALAVRPDFVLPWIGLAYLEVFRDANPAAGRKILDAIPANADHFGMVTVSRWDLAMLERDYPAAEKILADASLENFASGGDAPKTYYQGRLARARGDVDSARRYLAVAIADAEKRVHDNPGAAERHGHLGLLYAYMLRKDDAIREGRRAVELEPESQNAFHGAVRLANLALIYSLIGEPDQAIPLIERLLSTPGPVECSDYPYNMTRAELRLRWEWDALRGNPRFQKILAEPEPKTVLTNGRGNAELTRPR